MPNRLLIVTRQGTDAANIGKHPFLHTLAQINIFEIDAELLATAGFFVVFARVRLPLEKWFSKNPDLDLARRRREWNRL